MPSEPLVKRAFAFFDGQNLFHAAREAFGYTYPNYDVHALAQAVSERQGWTLAQARFYTGDRTDWIRLDRTTWETCLDPREYRPPRPSSP